MHRERMKKMGMSEKQIAQAKKIMDEARKKTEKVDDPQERRQIRQAAYKKIREEVWTDEQREKFGKRPNPGRRGKKQHQQGKGE